ncbi:hypothetical protein [Flavobacterium panacagri]|uniref:hypothetical protein n=1 Tax=Flavobacterium panacagri TaxID=3034146 RepID=UPI0025A626B1|nr:hypothetical protein [Flavobacterium panacagri]
MKSLNIVIILFLVCNIAFAQEFTKEMSQKRDLKIDSISKIDFLSYDYKYLDKAFKIKIPEEVYAKIVKDYNLNPEKIKKYKDSLDIVLMAEFDDWDTVRISGHRINYEWKRVGYHIWMNENEVLELAKKLNIKMPYRLQELFLNNDPKVASEIQNLRTKLFEQYRKEELMMIPTRQLLSLAFKYNPEIMELKNNHQKEHNKQKK